MATTGKSTSTSRTRKPADVTSYIASAPKAAQPHLRELRKLIKAVAPKAEERISYGMPAYFLNVWLLGVGGWTKYISIYPSGDDKGLERYRAEKSTLRFPHDEPLPVAKIKKLVEARVAKASPKPAAARRSASDR
jgi:uncharacterized protein YdhG (YjbR/CyaY superfamily)